MADVISNRMRLRPFDAVLDWSSNTVKAMLVDADTWTPNPDDDWVQTAITAGADELTDASYARVSLTGKSTTLDDANDRGLLDCDTIDFGDVSGAEPYTHLIVYRHVTNDTDSWILCVFDLGGTYTTDGSQILFVPNAAGLIEIV